MIFGIIKEPRLLDFQSMKLRVEKPNNDYSYKTFNLEEYYSRKNI